MPQAVAFVGGMFGVGAGTAFAGATFGSWVAGAAFAGTAIGGVVAKLVTGVALSALSRALMPKPRIDIPGLRTEQTLTGGRNPDSFILGEFATAGVLVAPMMSHGQAGKTPNAYLTYVIELAGRPGHQLEGLMLNGEPVPILETSPHADYGKRLGGRFTDYAWIKYYDGTQTVADPMLMSKYIPPYARPWTSDMVGHGICYAIVTCQYEREVFQQFPGVKFVLSGMPLYDPRKDSTAGGSGAQRWSNPTTWAATKNPAVMIYNILRGIEVGGDVWGGGIPAEDLPFAVWAAAMDACDASVNITGGSEAAFEAGFEVRVDDEPYQVIEELSKSCGAMLAERGGVWTIRVGGPGLPVLTITDDDLMADSPDQFRPFPPIAEIYNAITASWTDPDSLWEAREADPLYNTAWEAEDGNRRLTTSVAFPAVTRGTQVERLASAMIADHRRMRVHTISLPPMAEGLMPLDVISWTSDYNGYVAKTFEVVRIDRQLLTGRVGVVLREIEAGDWVAPVVTRPSPPDDVSPVLPLPQGVPGWFVEPWTVRDGANVARRPALRCTWDPEAADDARGIKIAIRKQGEAGAGEVVIITDVRAGEFVHLGVIPDQAYQMRARILVDRATEWSAWITATAPDVRLGWDELTDAAQSKLGDLEDWIDNAEPTIEAMENWGILVRSNSDDLVLDGTFALDFAEWPRGSLSAGAGRFDDRNLADPGWVLSTMPAPKAIRIAPADVPASNPPWKGTAYLPVTPGEEILVSFDYARAINAVVPRALIRFRDSAGSVISGATVGIRGQEYGSWLSASERVRVPANAVEAQVYVQGEDSNAVNATWITNIRAMRGAEAFASGRLQITTETEGDDAVARIGLQARVDGQSASQAALFLEAMTGGGSTILARADSLFLIDDTTQEAPFAYVGGELYANARLTARWLDVDELLTIQGGGALAAFKRSPDDETDGLFFGQIQEGAQTKFALSASRVTDSGIPQEVRFGSDGFKLTNAQHFYNKATPDPVVRRTTNLAVTNLTGAKMVRIPSAIGGGGGGGTYNNAGSAGGNTVIELYDGSTLKVTITANGGAGGGTGGFPGPNSGEKGIDPGNRGGGGDSGYGLDVDGRRRHGAGGKAGQRTSRDWIDVSTWATPRIKITIGSAGAGGAGSGAGNGAPGVAGMASYQILTESEVRAGPVPLAPTASGSFPKAANTPGSFPDLGPGHWSISVGGGQQANLGTVNFGGGITQGVNVATTFGFFASQTPTYTGGPDARTIQYLFYSMDAPQ